MNSVRDLEHQQNGKMDCPSCNQHLHYRSSKSDVYRGLLSSCFYSLGAFHRKKRLMTLEKTSLVVIIKNI